MAHIECITTEESVLENILHEFKNKCLTLDKGFLQKKLDSRFSKTDLYGRAWFQMYEEFIEAGGVLDVEIQRGFATFYRGIANIWMKRANREANGILPGLVDSIELKQIYDALDDAQNDYILKLVQESDNVDTVFRYGVSYLHKKQIESMQVIYIQDQLDPEYMYQSLVEFQQGMDLGLMRWRALSTYG